MLMLIFIYLLGLKLMNKKITKVSAWLIFTKYGLVIKKTNDLNSKIYSILTLLHPVSFNPSDFTTIGRFKLLVSCIYFYF
jgi:hypothetical protein